MRTPCGGWYEQRPARVVERRGDLVGLGANESGAGPQRMIVLRRPGLFAREQRGHERIHPPERQSHALLEIGTAAGRDLIALGLKCRDAQPAHRQGRRRQQGRKRSPDLPGTTHGGLSIQAEAGGTVGMACVVNI